MEKLRRKVVLKKGEKKPAVGLAGEKKPDLHGRQHGSSLC
jgi:hypothetical protein